MAGCTGVGREGEESPIACQCPPESTHYGRGTKQPKKYYGLMSASSCHQPVQLWQLLLNGAAMQEWKLCITQQHEHMQTTANVAPVSHSILPINKGDQCYLPDMASSLSEQELFGGRII